jgi:hypothetical protein
MIGNLGMLLPSESQALTTGFNLSETAYPIDKSVVDLFEEQVIENPCGNGIGI